MPGIDAYTVLCLHCDGANASTSFPDASSAAHTVTANGNAQVTTAQSKFSGAGLALDGTGDYLALDGSTDFQFGTGDFTVDLWLRIAALPNPAHVYDSRPAGIVGAYLALYVWHADGHFHYSDGTIDIAGTTNLNDAAWHHIAVTRAGTTVRVFVDGVIEVTGTSSVNLLNPAGRPWFGGKSYGADGGAQSVWGNMDEIRVSKGIARWTANFTPPTAPYDVPAGATYNDAPSGGLVLGGSDSLTIARTLAPSGGLVLGGSVATTRTYAPAPSAGIVLGGSAALTWVRASTPSSGIILGGSAAITWVRTSTPSGGIVLGGSVVTQIGGATSVSPIGGIVLGGSCVIAHTFPAVPTGGIVLGGTCTTVRSVVITVAPSGGIVLGGSVVTTLIPPGPTYTLTPGGGLVLGGTCTSSLNLLVIYTSTPSGGIRLDGVALVSQAAVIFPISDLSDGTWTDQVGGSNLWAAIDETSPSDADYIKSATAPVTADICQVEFPGTYDPQLSTGHALTYRYGSDQEGWTTVTQVLTGAQADAISDYNHLSVKFEAKA